MSTGRFKSTIRTLAALGWINGICYAADRLLNRVFSTTHLYRYYLVAQPVGAEPRLPSARGRSIEVRRLQPGDRDLAQLPREAEVIRRRFDNNALCLGAFRQTELIGFIWLQFGPYQEDEVRCSFIPGPEGRAVWDFDVYVDPRHRLGFAFSRLWDETDSLLRERGIRWTLSRISAYNVGSLNAHKKLGYEVLGSSTFVVIGPAQLTLTTVKPYIHLSLSAASFPVLRLSAPPDAAAKHDR